ncbi:glycoside hydrolase family 16 protein, partial [Tamlana crocina]
TASVQSATTEFHVYGLEWTPEKLVFSVDGKVHYTYNPTNKNASTWPFNSDQFLSLNVAMGGTLGGNIDPNFISGTMEIDYVRVYK